MDCDYRLVAFDGMDVLRMMSEEVFFYKVSYVTAIIELNK